MRIVGDEIMKRITTILSLGIILILGCTRDMSHDQGAGVVNANLGTKITLEGRAIDAKLGSIIFNRWD